MSDVMRSQYREMTEAEKAQILELKHMGENFCNLCDALRSPNPDIDLCFIEAKINMQQAVMWATKGVTA